MDRDTLSKNVESRKTRAQRVKPGGSLQGGLRHFGSLATISNLQGRNI